MWTPDPASGCRGLASWIRYPPPNAGVADGGEVGTPKAALVQDPRMLTAIGRILLGLVLLVARGESPLLRGDG